jgi:hypothetical protein
MQKESSTNSLSTAAVAVQCLPVAKVYLFPVAAYIQGSKHMHALAAQSVWRKRRRRRRRI